MGVECLFRLLIYRQRARAGRGEEIKRIPKKEGERGNVSDLSHFTRFEKTAQYRFAVSEQFYPKYY